MINKKFFKVFLLIIFTGLITSCINNQSMKPEDFKDQKPRLIIEEYLSGNVTAWGILQNRSGKVTRQFSADRSAENCLVTLPDLFCSIPQALTFPLKYSSIISLGF